MVKFHNKMDLYFQKYLDVPAKSFFWILVQETEILISDVIAICLWTAQFYLNIQYSVLSREDKDNEWTSENMAELGYSFWFVAGAAVTSFINIVIIFIANTEKEVDTVIPVLEEKTNGAIMLY